MTDTPPSPPTPRAEANARRADAERIASGYESTGSALEMGAVLLDGTSYPQARIRVPLAMVNRHGLIAGATGTGKTKTLQVLTEQLSAAGVPVVVADIKGDLSGLAQAGTSNDRIAERAVDTGDDWAPTAYPVEFLALGGVGSGVAGTGHHDVLRADSAGQGARLQQHAGIVARPDLPLRGQRRTAAARPQGPPSRDSVPHERRRKG